MSWNIQSRNCSILGNKLDMCDFKNILDKHNIVCLQEIRRPIEIPGFTSYNSLRSETDIRAGGGVSISVHSSIANGVKEVRHKSYSDCISIKMSKDYFINISTLYAPTSALAHPHTNENAATTHGII